MKKFIYVLFCVLVMVSMTFPAFATETDPVEPVESIEPETVTEPVESDPVVTDPVVVETGDSGQVVVNVNVPASDPLVPDEATEDPEEDEDETIVPYMMTSLNGDDMDGSVPSLPAALVNLFGSYEPRIQTVTEVLSDGSTIEYEQYVPGVAGMDWDWIASVSLFSLSLYCVFRVIGGCLKWN